MLTHLPAFLRAGAAGYGAFLAVLILMPGAFLCALVAEFGADAAKVLRRVAAQAHQLCGSITGRGALHIELDTASHHVNIIFPGAGCCTMITY